MKKIFLYVIAFIILSIGNNAYAGDNFYRTLSDSSRSFTPYLDKTFKYGYNTGPYIGVDYLGINTDILEGGSSSDANEYSFSGGKAVLGIRLAQAFSIEGFYSQSEKYNNVTFFDPLETQISGYGLDGIIYTPIAPERIYLLTSLGWGKYKSTTEREDGTIEEEKEANAFRYGFGLEYTFNENFAIRGMYNVISINKWEDYDRFNEYQIGMRLYF